MRQVLSRSDPGACDVVIHGALANAQGTPELQGCRRQIGSKQGPEQTVVELGVKKRHLDAIGSDDLAVLVLQAPDQAPEAEPPEVIGHLRRGVEVAEQTESRDIKR